MNRHRVTPIGVSGARNSGPRRAILFLCAVLGSVSAVLPARAQILFDDVTNSAGFTYAGESFGAAWGDVDGDGLPDLWVTHHLDVPGLYLNDGAGAFTDVAAAMVIGDLLTDTHGAGFADFDNDGDQDLLQAVGGGAGQGSKPNLFLVNDGGLLTDLALEWGIDYPLGRSRTPLWLDVDRDGELDLMIANLVRPDGQAPSPLFSRRGDMFDDETLAAGFVVDENAFFAQSTGWQSQDPPMVLVHSLTYPQRAYRYDEQPIVDVRATLGLDIGVAPAQDSAIGDFNGDLLQDLFIVRQFVRPDLAAESSTAFRSYITVSGDEKGFEWQTDGDVTIEISPEFFIDLGDIFIGAGGANPASYSFTLSAADAANFGVMAHTPGVDTGVYIGRDPVLPEWQLFVSKSENLELNFSVGSTDQITNVTPVGFTPDDGGATDILLARDTGTFVDVSAASGLTDHTPCISVGDGDFDNDMDLDVYLVCASKILNLPNILLENQGGGSFVPLVGAGGAEGSDLGRGDTVAVADYDLDGFLDLFVANGQDLGHFSIGPDELFRNVTANGNHWLEIDLEGVLSNRDGIGARLFAVAGGVAQAREQNGGAHRFSQNHSRVHFGLATNTQVDALFVQWPSGRQQQIVSMPADQVIRIVERTGADPIGQPTYQAGVDRGVFLWQDTIDGTFHVRASGDGGPSTFTLHLLATDPIQIVGGVGIGVDDVLTGGPNGFSLIANVDSDEAGLDFQMDPGTSALIAVERDGLRNPRDLHVGAQGLPREPGGWILAPGALPVLPPFQTGVDLGLFIGFDGPSDTIQARWNGDGMQHDAQLTLFADRPILSVAGVALEGDGLVSRTVFAAMGQETVTSDFDGLDVALRADASLVGVAYNQDGLFQSHRANPGTFELGQPNAYFIVAQ